MPAEIAQIEIRGRPRLLLKRDGARRPRGGTLFEVGSEEHLILQEFIAAHREPERSRELPRPERDGLEQVVLLRRPAHAAQGHARAVGAAPDRRGEGSRRQRG